MKRSDNYKLILPSKIFENVALRKPILLGVDGEARKLINDYKVGVFYEPENKMSFYDALGKIHAIDLKKHVKKCIIYGYIIKKSTLVKGVCFVIFVKPILKVIY